MCYISMSNTDFTTKSNTTRQVESFMEKDTTVQDKKKQIIDANQPTGELLTSRVGLALFAQYPQNIRLMLIIERMFGLIPKNKIRVIMSKNLSALNRFTSTEGRCPKSIPGDAPQVAIRHRG